MGSHHRCQMWIVLALLLGLGRAAHAGPTTFEGVGDFPGGDDYSIAHGISADGSTVVGTSRGDAGSEAFRWTSSGGMVGLGFLSGGTSSIAQDISDDLETIVGYARIGVGWEAFRWTSTVGMVALGDYVWGNRDSKAYAVKADGSGVVGYGSPVGTVRATAWTLAGAMIDLGYYSGPSGTVTWSRAYDISADGTIVVGTSEFRAFIWTGEGGMEFIGGLPAGTGLSSAYAISADGSTIVGSADTLHPLDDTVELTWPMRWTSAEGMMTLGSFSSGTYQGHAKAVSGDGSTIVGVVYPPGGRRAFIWDSVEGMRFLADVLTDHGVDMTGWILWEANGISDDGRVIVGEGQNPDGDYEGWVAVLGDANSNPLPALGPVCLSILASLIGVSGLRRSGARFGR